MLIFYNILDGDIVRLFTEPASVMMLLFPFIPAIIFARISQKSEKKVAELLGVGSEQEETASEE